MAAPGYDEQQRLRAAGFTPEQIVAWRQSRAENFASAGFTPEQIRDYFGEAPPTTAKLREDIVVGFASAPEADPVQEARGFVQALQAGYQQSVGGLAQRMALPDIVLDEDADFVETVGAALGQAVGDLPISVASFLPGAAIGAQAAGAAATPTRNPVAIGAAGVVGAGVGGGATSGFVTEGVRQSLINFYNENENRGKPASAREFASRYIAALLDPSTLKTAGEGAAIGAASGAVGGAARAALPGVVKNAATRQVIVTSAEATSAVAATAALAGELPDASAFAAAAAVAVGLDAGFAVSGSARAAAKRLQERYLKTGEQPRQVLEQMRTDPILRQEIIGGEAPEPPTGMRRETVQTPDGAEPVDLPNTPEVRAAVEGNPSAAHAGMVAAVRPDVFRAAPAAADAAPVQPTPVSESRANILAKIKAPVDSKRTMRQRVDDLRFSFVNDLQYVVSEAEEAYRSATGRRLSVEQNPGELMRLAFGAHARAELEINAGIFNKEGRKSGYSLADIVKSVDGRYDEFVAYAVSRRVLEKAAQGFETGFDVLDADLVVKAADADLEAAFDRFQTWSNSALSRLRDAGLLSDEQLAKTIEQNRDYVPFARVMYDDPKGPAGVTTRGLPVRKPVKRFTGSDKDILDPLEVAVKNRYALEQIAANNIARRRLVDFNDALPEEARFLTRSKKAMQVTTIAESDAQLKKFLEDNGLDIEDATGLHLYRAVTKKLDANEFIVFEEGKPVVYEAANPDLVKSLMRLDDQSSTIVKGVFQKLALAQRAGVTLAPEFVLKSAIRDQLGAFLQNPFTVVPFVDLFDGLLSLYQNDAVVKRWINAGGANSAMLAIDRRALGKTLREKMRRPQSADLLTAKFYWNVALGPVRFLQDISLFAENAMRVGAFKRAERAGLSREVAGLRSRDVTLDFARMGAQVRSYNLITAWVGAALNGIDRFHTAFTRDPVGTTVKTFAAVTLPSLILHAFNRDEEWYQNLPDWEKLTFWHFDSGMRDERGQPVIIRVPMPHQFGAMFGYLPVAMLEEFDKANPEVGGRVWDTLKQTYNVPVFPTAVTPVMEVAMNYSFLNGRPLVSEGQRALLPEYRYTPYTTQTTRELAKLLSTVPGGFIGPNFTTPVALEHMVRSYGGILGEQALRKLDRGLRVAGVVADVPAPAETLADDSVFGFFFSRFPNASGALEDFYRNAERMDQIEATIKAEARRQDPEEVERILRLRGAPAVKPDAARRAIAKLRQMGYAVHFSPDMDPREKRQLLDQIAANQAAIANGYNQAFEAFQEAEKKR